MYDEKYETLKKDTDFLFLGAIRSIEDQMLENLYGSPFSYKNIDSTGATVIKVHFDQKMDTFNSMAFLGKEIKNFQVDTMHKITVRSKIVDDKNLMGSLGLAIAIQMDSTSLDSLQHSHENVAILSTLEQHVEKDIQGLELPLEYKIVCLDDKSGTKGSLISSSYTDLLSGESFALEYERYQAFLFKKMVPEILFSLFLFSSIALAFYVVYQKLAETKKIDAAQKRLCKQCDP